MRRIKRVLVLAAAAGLSAAAAMAAGVGTTGAQFLQVGVGARPLAMGNAFAALPDDANAINWNPGALGEVKARNLTASYNSLFQDENQGFIAYASPVGEAGALAVGLNYLMVSDIPRRAGDSEEPDSTFANQNFVASLAYGKTVSPGKLSLGGSLKYIREDLDSFKGNAMAIDLGALCQTPIERLTAGFTVKNLGTKIGPDPLPLTFKGGAAYRMFARRLVLASDVDWLAMDRRAYWDLGAEFWADKALAVRAGYQLGHGADNAGSIVGFSAGFGVKIIQLSLDYAFVPFGDLGDTHRVTLGWSF
ncbi:MAG TPA: hypothetical protein DEB40_12740 [Elusimicrobia bacterium]|nr:hypothetical protein [Elusimicrobiota bacterium]HBT62601.1 hypothetical protein [Elusimicrobiota bacterium]